MKATFYFETKEASKDTEALAAQFARDHHLPDNELTRRTPRFTALTRACLARAIQDVRDGTPPFVASLTLRTYLITYAAKPEFRREMEAEFGIDQNLPERIDAVN